jgi:hypothetical protein
MNSVRNNHVNLTDLLGLEFREDIAMYPRVVVPASIDPNHSGSTYITNFGMNMTTIACSGGAAELMNKFVIYARIQEVFYGPPVADTLAHEDGHARVYKAYFDRIAQAAAQFYGKCLCPPCFSAWIDWFVAAQEYAGAEANFDHDRIDHDDPTRPSNEHPNDQDIANDIASENQARSHLADMKSTKDRICSGLFP